MDEGSIEIIPSCGKCGSNDLVGPDDMTDESIITCNSCGAENGTRGEFIERSKHLAAQKFTEELQATLGKAFDGSSGIKFTKSSD
jgi:hypothetical protein